MKKVLMLSLFLLTTLFSVQAQEWHIDFEEAKSLAAEEEKPIVLVFQGSDWCTPCIKLDREIFETETFKAYAEDHFVMLKADFPRKKQNALSEEQQKKNQALAERYNQQGYFPLVVVLDKDGKVLGETGYQKASPEAYIEVLSAFN